MNIDEESSFTASSVTVNIKATYAEFTKEMSFSVAYAGIDDSDEELAPVDSEEEEQEPESESEAESEPEVIDQAASSWDGWKSLLDSYKFLPEGVVLPKPNPDPSYIPTPPKPSIQKFDARGSTEIIFSEDVFMYPNLKNLKIPKPPSNQILRELQ